MQSNGTVVRAVHRRATKSSPTPSKEKSFLAFVAQSCIPKFGTILDDRTALVRDDVLSWIQKVPDNSIHAIVTDPPYGVMEYDEPNQQKLRNGKGGVWRIPPSFDGAKRSPLPRFTVMTDADTRDLCTFFSAFANEAVRVLVPGAHVFIASNPLVSTFTFGALIGAGFEKRGEIIRMVQTLRGGDRPKGAHVEFSDVTVMPRSCWEPWGLFRKPCEGTVAENLRAWGTGGLRRKSASEPFKDVILCSPTRPPERRIAPHPSLKPQKFLRQIVRAALPFGRGIILDPFAGSGSTLAAASHLGYASIGVERDDQYYRMSCQCFSKLRALKTDGST